MTVALTMFQCCDAKGATLLDNTMHGCDVMVGAFMWLGFVHLDGHHPTSGRAVGQIGVELLRLIVNWKHP